MLMVWIRVEYFHDYSWVIDCSDNNMQATGILSVVGLAQGLFNCPSTDKLEPRHCLPFGIYYTKQFLLIPSDDTVSRALLCGDCN
jgi:hypothetical protein